VRLVRGGRLLDEQLTAHAEVGEDRVVMAVERQPQVLAAAAGPRDGPSGEAGSEVGAAGHMAAHGPGVVHLDHGDRAAGDPALDPAADDLDLGQLGH
jgi:hypothetical protein